MSSSRIVPPHPTDNHSHHDDRYHTKSQVDEQLANKADSSNVYPSSSVDTMIEGVGVEIAARLPAWPMQSLQRYSGMTHGMGRAGTIAGTAVSVDYIYFTPVYVPAETTFDRIGINVTTAVAASTARLGIFTVELPLGLATLVLDAGTVDSGTTGTKEQTIDITLPVGWYWLALQATAAISIYVAAAAMGYAWTPNGQIQACRVQALGTSGPFTATETTNSANANVYGVHLRVA